MRGQFKAYRKSEIYNVFGASWGKGSASALARTGSSIGLLANVGVDATPAVNDFDNAPIFGEMREVTDTMGNVFVKVPKFYIKKVDELSLKTWEVSRVPYKGFYLPWCFWDFTNNRELPYVDIGKYKASLGAGNKLESKPGVYPLVNTNIVNMRTYAKNNNTGGLQGYQQLDVHTYNMLQTLMTIEFATLDVQTIMKGFTAGRYSADDKAIAATDPAAGNTIVVSNTTGAHYRVGQPISCGTSLGGVQRFYGRNITAIDADTPEAGQTTISFDGAPVALSIDDIIFNSGWKNGFSAGISASSGSIVNNSDGKHPCSYRGIESPFGDVWQFVDGVNSNEHQAWVTKNAEDYASNVFAHPYEQLSYVNHDANGYVTAMGSDPNNPFAAFPMAIGGSTSTYYADYYYQATGQRIARVGGGWLSGAFAGPWCWTLSASSSDASVAIGGRLLKKAL